MCEEKRIDYQVSKTEEQKVSGNWSDSEKINGKGHDLCENQQQSNEKMQMTARVLDDQVFEM